MIRDASKILVFDLELTCEEPTPQGYAPEIIQVGLCYLELPSLEITGKTQFLVKPMKNSISEFCTTLTGITARDLHKHGVEWRVALKWMIEKHGFRRHITAAWGHDHEAINTECLRYGYPPVYTSQGGEFIDLSTLASARGMAWRCGLSKALSALGMDFEGTPHRADDDAFNTARIAKVLLEPLKLPVLATL